jgi:hypothetical protein
MLGIAGMFRLCSFRFDGDMFRHIVYCYLANNTLDLLSRLTLPRMDTECAGTHRTR